MSGNALLNLETFRRAAETAKKVNGHNHGLDVSPITQVSQQLELLTPNLEAFLKLDAVTRCHLRAGAIKLGKRFERDDKLYHFLRGMIGNTRDIFKLDADRLRQTRTFLEAVGGI